MKNNKCPICGTVYQGSSSLDVVAIFYVLFIAILSTTYWYAKYDRTGIIFVKTINFSKLTIIKQYLAMYVFCNNNLTYRKGNL